MQGALSTLDWEKLREEEEEQKKQLSQCRVVSAASLLVRSCNVTSLSELAGINLGSENELYADMELTSLQKAESLGRLSSRTRPQACQWRNWSPYSQRLRGLLHLTLPVWLPF